jgi:type II secretory pathway pseudopilin PulG
MRVASTFSLSGAAVQRASGFTLAQLIGSLSVLAILVSVITPVAIRRIDQAARDAEATSLAALSEAYLQTAIKTKQFVAATNFPQTIAAYLNVPTNNVRINKRGYTRVFMADPNLSINGGGLPYSQTDAGSATLPTGTRFLFIGTAAKALPAITVNTTNFNSIWNAAKNTVPSALSSWGGRGDDLMIERLEVGPQFHKIVLMNIEHAPTTGYYQIENFGTNALAGQTRASAYYIDGTTISFYQNNDLNFRETIREDESFVYQNGKWGRRMTSEEDNSGDFGQLVDRFLQQPVPCDPNVGSTQRAVINAFYDYLWGYSDWAFGDPKASPVVPPFAGSGQPSTPKYPSYTVLYNAQNHMSGNTASFTQNLIQ